MEAERREEYEGEFINDIGLGVSRVLYAITWFFSAILAIIPLLFIFTLFI